MTVAVLESIYIIFFKIALCNDFDITNFGELKFMLRIFIICDYTN